MQFYANWVMRFILPASGFLPDKDVVNLGTNILLSMIHHDFEIESVIYHLEQCSELKYALAS